MMSESEFILRWAVHGCGAIAGDFVHALRCLPAGQHQVVAACASSIDRAKQFVAKHGLSDAKAYDNAQHVYEDDNVDIVYVAKLNHEHQRATEAALSGGKHVLCEKPLGLNANQTMSMCRVARTSGKFLMEGYWSRFFPVYQKLKELIDSEIIGKPNLLQADFGYTMLESNKFKLEFGGGCLLATGCYLPMLAQYVFDEKPEQIVATKGTLFDNGCDDSASVALQYSGGRLAHLLYTGSAVTQRRAVISGPKGYIEIPSNFWCPETVRVYKVTHGRDATLAKEFRYRLPVPYNENVKFTFPNSQGLAYEAAAVRTAIRHGRQERGEMTLDNSVELAEISDEIRRQLGVTFPQDEQ